MTEDAEVLWLDNVGNFVKDRFYSKILDDESSKCILETLRQSGEYIFTGRFPADLNWKTCDGRIIYCPTKNKLEQMLELYLSEEKYEEACLIRDQLKSL